MEGATLFLEYGLAFALSLFKKILLASSIRSLISESEEGSGKSSVSIKVVSTSSSCSESEEFNRKALLCCK